MAEGAAAFGIVTGVVGLLPLCAQGCSFIENVVKADRHAEEQMIRIQMQQWASLANTGHRAFTLLISPSRILMVQPQVQRAGFGQMY